MAGSRVKKSLRKVLQSFLVELVLYGVLVTAYFWAVLHYLGSWVYHLFEHEPKTYAFVALGLIIGQGFLLELLTRVLLALAGKERLK